MADKEQVDFVNLHMHSEYSRLDGFAHPEDMASRAAELGQPALAITDHGNMSGVIPFYDACKRHGIKPILGIEFYVAPRGRRDKPEGDEEAYYHLTGLAENFKGYQNLMKLATLANTEGFYRYPRIDHELLEEYGEGLTIASGCLGGEVAQAIIHNDAERLQQTLEFYKGVFGEHYALEIQNHGIPEEDLVRAVVLEQASKNEIMVVAAGDSHYVWKEQHRIHEKYACMQTNKTLTDPKRFKLDGEGYYLLSGREMMERFPECPEAISNTLIVASRVDIELPVYENQLPHFVKTPDGMTSAEYLTQLCRQGLRERFGDKVSMEIVERTRKELKVINGAGFADYFLIVGDLIKWSKEQGIPVGPGRGSAAGSLVAYLLGITEINPIQYGLLFERFLNEERVSMPDIDIDFGGSRAAVIQYVTDLYGADKVCQLITFGTAGAKASINRMAKVNDLPVPEMRALSKLIPEIPGTKLTDYKDRLYQFAQGKDPLLTTVIDDAMAVEGYVVTAGKHAAGIIIAPEPLDGIVPLQKPVRGEVGFITQYDLPILNRLGLLKIDFLGLENLVAIRETIKLVEDNYGTKLDITKIPLDDLPTFTMLQQGDVVGVFQLEGVGARDILQKIKPVRIEDLAIVNALNRPGPLEGRMENGKNVVEEFLDRRNGRSESTPIAPEAGAVLAETEGLILYQDQVMQIANQVAGYTLSEADTLRAAMGKKDSEKMAHEKERFVKQALERGVVEENAVRLWNYMEKFAEYGFNKAHAMAYATVGYQTAYLRCHYPLEYTVALCNSRGGEFDEKKHSIMEVILDAKRRNLSVEKPDINRSQVNFSVLSRERQTISYGLAQVKSVGESVAAAIVEEREKGGAYSSLSDLMRRNLDAGLKKNTLEALIYSGALDEFGHRDALLKQVPDLVKLAASAKRGRKVEENTPSKVAKQLVWPDQAPAPEGENGHRRSKVLTITNLENEADVLGISLSGHIMDVYQSQLSKYGVMSIYDMGRSPAVPVNIRIAGRVRSSNQFKTRQGKVGIRLTIEDQTGECDVWGFGEMAEKLIGILSKGRGRGPIVVRGNRGKLGGGERPSFEARDASFLEAPVVDKDGPQLI